MVAVPAPARPRVLVSFKRASADGAAVPIVAGAPIVAIVCQLPRPAQRVPDWLQEVSIAVQRVGKADWKGAVRCDQVSSRVGHPGTQPRWGVNPLVVQPASDPPEGRYTNTQPNSTGQQNRACVTGQKEPGENAHGRHGARRGIEPKQTVLQRGRTSVACSSSTEPSFRPPSSRADSQLCSSSLLNSLSLDGTSVPSAH